MADDRANTHSGATPADRLREAASRAENAGIIRYGSDPAYIEREVAALLRAVADADRDLTHGVPSCVTLPALALASAVLGDRDD